MMRLVQPRVIWNAVAFIGSEGEAPEPGVGQLPAFLLLWRQPGRSCPAQHPFALCWHPVLLYDGQIYQHLRRLTRSGAGLR